MNAKRQTPSAAKSSDVLGQLANEASVPAAWRLNYHRLLELRQKLLKDADDLERNAQDETPSFSMHMADAATDSFDRDLALSLLGLEQSAVGEIDEALQRIQDGTYGVCEQTGEPIPRERLAAIPWARFTTEAQAELERQGQAPHAHLNAVKSARTETQDCK